MATFSISVLGTIGPGNWSNPSIWSGGIKPTANQNITIAEDEFADDSGYTFSSNKNLERDISSSDIELANKINLLKKSGLI